MNLGPLVSVIIPTYNRASIVGRAIQSALDQTYKNVEVIVVDDGSTDNTQEILKNFHGIVVVHKENGGQASARNAGLAKAKGSFVASLDSDDVWYPSFLEKCVQKIIVDNLGFAFANWDQHDLDGKVRDFISTDIIIEPYFHREENGWVNLTSEELKNIYVQGCPSPSSAGVIRRDIIKNGWNEDMKIGDDWYLYIEALYSGECTAAFTLERLWVKHAGNLNVYDGRRRKEVLEHLYIADLKKILQDFKSVMNKSQYKVLQNKHVYALVELAKHNLIREYNVPKTLSLLSHSFHLDIIQTLKSIPEVIRFGIQRIKDEKIDRSINNAKQ